MPARTVGEAFGSLLRIPGSILGGFTAGVAEGTGIMGAIRTTSNTILIVAVVGIAWVLSQ